MDFVHAASRSAAGVGLNTVLTCFARRRDESESSRGEPSSTAVLPEAARSFSCSGLMLPQKTSLAAFWFCACCLVGRVTTLTRHDASRNSTVM